MEVEFVSYFEATSHGVWLKSFVFKFRVVDSISRPLKCAVTTLLQFFWLRTTKGEVYINTSTSNI